MELLQPSYHEPIIDEIANPGAERYVLAYIFRYPDSIYDIAMSLNPQDFSLLPNRTLYQAMLRVSERAVVDPQTVISSCREHEVLDSVGGEEYIAHIMMTTVNKENLQYNIDIIKLLSLRRKTYLEALSIMQDAVSDKAEDVSKFLGRQQQRFIDLSLQLDNADNVVNLSDGMDEWLEQLAMIDAEIPGLETGFSILDKEIGGLIKQRLYVIAARSKVGKSTLLMNWALNISVRNQAPILYIDTEMSTNEVRSRALANMSGVFEKKISNGTYVRDARDIERIRLARNEFKQGNFYHVYLPNFTAESIYNLSRKYKIKHNIEALFFDYIKLPDSADLRQAAEYQQLGYITNMLKNHIAGDLDIPVVTGAQQNRAGINAEEEDESLVAGSDRILFFSNYLFFLRNKREEEIQRDGERCGNQTLTLIASRHGGDYRAWINYDRPVLRMHELMRANRE